MQTIGHLFMLSRDPISSVHYCNARAITRQSFVWKCFVNSLGLLLDAPFNDISLKYLMNDHILSKSIPVDYSFTKQKSFCE